MRVSLSAGGVIMQVLLRGHIVEMSIFYKDSCQTKESTHMTSFHMMSLKVILCP